MRTLIGINNLVTGFNRTYQKFLSHKAELLTDDGPMVTFRQQRIRLLLRDTLTYASIQRQCLQPDALKNSIAFCLKLEQLCRTFLAADRPSDWSILSTEGQAMVNLDIPFFEYWSDSCDLPISATISIPNYFEQSGHSAACRRITMLSETDLKFQQTIIRGAFTARRKVQLIRTECESSRLDNDLILNQATLLAETERIARELIERTVYAYHGDLYWLGLSLLPKSELMRFGPIATGLYDDAIGVAIFLAALDHVRGTQEYDFFVKSLLLPLTTQIRQSSKYDLFCLVRNWGLGLRGAGGIIYALACLNQWNVRPAVGSSLVFRWAIEPAEE
jgi:lantibiotic modifying enzyme